MLRRPQHYSTAVFRVNSIHNYINDIHIFVQESVYFCPLEGKYKVQPRVRQQLLLRFSLNKLTFNFLYC